MLDEGEKHLKPPHSSKMASLHAHEAAEDAMQHTPMSAHDDLKPNKLQHLELNVHIPGVTQNDQLGVVRGDQMRWKLQEQHVDTSIQRR